MKTPDYGSPGKTRSSESHPLQIIIILVAVLIGLTLITQYKTLVPKAKGLYGNYREQARIESEKQEIAEREALRIERENLERKKQYAAKKRNKSKEQIVRREAVKQDSGIPVQVEIPPITERVPIQPGEVTLSIREYGFLPVESVGPGMHKGYQHQLQKKALAEIKKEPAYKGYARWYGFMELGSQEVSRLYFVLDLQKNETFVLYFDANKNLDLSDDGVPLKHTGSGDGGFDGFATNIVIPWKSIIKDFPYVTDFKIWFFMNEGGWTSGQKASHYSRTQLEQMLLIGGKEYRAVIVDTGENDADLTNDGIIIDANRNGDFDPGERPATEYVLDGKTYKFKIVW